MARLSAQIQLFVMYYCNTGDPIVSAEYAGYAPKIARLVSSQLLKNETVVHAIEDERKRRCEKVGINAEWALNSALRILNRCEGLEPVIKNGKITGQYKADNANAVKTLEMICKLQGLYETSDPTGETKGAGVNIHLPQIEGKPQEKKPRI